ncbi:hypothetical protein ASPZODRAFT_29861, partial [Penicilliopsis zonata CBS 506.65]
SSLVDIQQQDTVLLDLRAEIINGLSASPRTLPSLLLWDERGLSLFDQYTTSSAYYVYRKEQEIVNQYALELADLVPAGSILLELGCGSLSKTAVLLEALERLQRPVTYYALDVSSAALSQSLARLTQSMGVCRFVSIQGLLGTYDDGLAWLRSKSLSERTNTPVTILWLGNSVTNSGQQIARDTLAQFSSVCSCQFLLGVDVCQDVSAVMQAYSPADPSHAAFIMNGLVHANKVMGQEGDTFDLDDWTFTTTLNPTSHSLDVAYCPRRDVQVTIDDDTSLSISQGTPVNVVTSGKWSDEDVRTVVGAAGLQVLQVW